MMARTSLLWILLAALAVNLLAASQQASPGYMDAAYYYSGGERLATGHGFTEQVLWNYLDDPAGLPHPSHAYWMPLTSIAIAASQSLLPFLPPLRAAQAGQVALALLAVFLAFRLALALTGEAHHARTAGLLAAFSGFYAPFLPATDSFGLVMALGAAFQLWLTRLAGKPGPGWAGLGALAGLLYLARADGLLWLGLAGLCALWLAPPVGWRARLAAGLWVVLGFGLLAGPWLARNFAVFGSLLSPGGGQALWLLDYNELFSYPAAQLTPARWLAAGPAVWLANIRLALGNNLQSALAVNGLVLLGPLAVWAAARQWRAQPAVRAGGLVYALLFLVFTFVFPLPGYRGGFFHASAALMPLVWVLAPLGLAQAAEKYADWRGRPALPFLRLFTALGLGVAVLLTGTALAAQLPTWDDDAQTFQSLEAQLQSTGADPNAIVLVTNPPGYYAATGRPAIAIPDGGPQTLLAVAARYGARYLWLGPHHPDELAALYNAPASVPRLRHLATHGEFHLFEVQP